MLSRLVSVPLHVLISELILTRLLIMGLAITQALGPVLSPLLSRVAPDFRLAVVGGKHLIVVSLNSRIVVWRLRSIQAS